MFRASDNGDNLKRSTTQTTLSIKPRLQSQEQKDNQMCAPVHFTVCERVCVCVLISTEQEEQVQNDLQSVYPAIKSLKHSCTLRTSSFCPFLAQSKRSLKARSSQVSVEKRLRAGPCINNQYQSIEPCSSHTDKKGTEGNLKQYKKNAM